MSKKKSRSSGSSGSIGDPTKEKSGHSSAFRAVNTSDQMVTANDSLFPVQFPNEIFDLNNEYIPDTATFTPKKDGVYLIIASISFFPSDPNVNYRLVLNIRIGDIPVVTDDKFFGPNPVLTGDQVSVTGILKLKKDDAVSISLFSTTNGIIKVEDPEELPRGTHFEATRLI